MANATPISLGKKEYDFRDGHFKFIREFVYAKAGIALSEIKRDMVYSRLVRRLRALNIGTFDIYLDLIKSGDADEIIEFINSITTNLTAFFRENHHFEFLRSKVLPDLINANQKHIRIWSAGCSTGEEPYSIAITIENMMKHQFGFDIKILATDLDSQVLSTARTGLYTEDRLKDVPRKIVSASFSSVTTDKGPMMKVSSHLQEFIRFNQLNLMNSWPMNGKFDVIFCRNVVIYFDKKTQAKLFKRYADILNPGGYLILGHSESMFGLTTRFESIGKTIYQQND